MSVPCQRCSAFLFDPPECACPDIGWYLDWRLATERARVVYLENALAIQEHPKFRAMLALCQYRVGKLEERMEEKN